MLLVRFTPGLQGVIRCWPSYFAASRVNHSAVSDRRRYACPSNVYAITFPVCCQAHGFLWKPDQLAQLRGFNSARSAGLENRSSQSARCHHTCLSIAAAKHEVELRKVSRSSNSINISLRLHNTAGQATTFFHLHIWFHMVLSYSIIAPIDIPPGMPPPGSRDCTGLLTPVETLRGPGAKMICEILGLCEILNPMIFCTYPFLGQPLFAAGMVVIKGMRSLSKRPDYRNSITCALRTPSSRKSRFRIRRDVTFVVGHLASTNRNSQTSAKSLWKLLAGWETCR